MPSPLPIGLLALLLAPAVARADVAPPDRALSNDRLVIGVAADGSLGNSNTDIGVRFDPDGPEGEMPLGGDVLSVGQMFEVWSLSGQIEGVDWVREQTAPWGGSDLVLEWEAGDAHDLAWLHGVGGDDNMLVDTWLVVRHGEGVAWMVMDLEALVDVSDLWLTRVYDPDLDDWIDSSTATQNSVREGVVVASGTWDGRSWALAGADDSGGLGTGGICTWCTLPDDVLAGDTDTNGDDQLGLTVPVGDMAAGDSRRVVFAYAFAADADSAADAAAVAAATQDLDGDGSAWGSDCDDLDPLVGPDRLEDLDNGVDDDCDGEVDEADETDVGDTGDRDGWDQEVPDDGGSSDGGAPDGGASDGGSSADGGSADGGTSDGGGVTTDGGLDDDESGSKGCSHLAMAPPFPLLLLGLTILARRRR